MFLTESESLLVSIFYPRNMTEIYSFTYFIKFTDGFPFKLGFPPLNSNWELENRLKSPVQTIWEHSSKFHNFICENSFSTVSKVWTFLGYDFKKYKIYSTTFVFLLLLYFFFVNTQTTLTVFKSENVFINKLIIFPSHILNKFLIDVKINLTNFII